MGGPPEISDDDVLLRRLPPNRDGFVSMTPREGGGHRATSAFMSVRSGERGGSCSQLAITSPQDLLEQLRNQGKDPSDWHVCRIFVRDVRALGLQVVPAPTDIDPGHCEIRPADGLKFAKRTPQKLARKTRILTPAEVQTLQAGATLTD